MNDRASDPALRAVLETLSVVVIDPSGTSRASVRKTLTDLGVEFDNIHLVDSYRVAAKTLSLKRPDIVLLEYDGEWGEARGVLAEFRKQYERPADPGVFFTARNTESYVKSVAARDDVAGLFFKPYTYAYLSRQLADAVGGRRERDLYHKFLREARTLYWRGDLEAARRQFERAKSLARAEVHAHAYIGEMELAVNPLAAAKVFTEALRIDPDDYRCLTGNVRALMALKKFREAYVFHEKALRNFPVIPSRLPELIRLSMLVGKFEDVLDYLRVYFKASVNDPSVRKSLGSALVVLGKRILAEKGAADAREVFEKAYGLCRGHERMLVELFSAMLRGGLGEDAKRLLANEIQVVRESPEILLAEFEHVHAHSPPERVVIDGTDLLRRGIRSPLVYEAVIRGSRALRRRPGVIDELINSAIADYPDEIARFEALRTST